MRLTRKDILMLLGSFIILVVFGMIARFLFGEDAIMVVIILTSILILTAAFEFYRRLIDDTRRLINDTKKLKRHYQQIEALFSLYFTIKPQNPLPDMGKWSASPDFLKKLSEIVFHFKPELVIEAGSGVSTLILAYCLKQIGRGKVITLDHDAKYAAITQELIVSHGLEEFATVVYAPVIEYTINQTKWLWYDISHLSINEPIDFLIVDGPWGKLQKMARYPALPLLYEHFRNRAIILVDDGARKDEKEMVERWVKEFQDLTYEYLDFEKGAFILCKQKK